MKPMKILTSILLATLSLAACTARASTPAPVVIPSVGSPITPTPSLVGAPAQVTHSGISDEAQIRELVENFGKRLQAVSLQAPDAAQEMEAQYSEFVSPELLETWMSDVTKAPGRMVSSPWSDRIEITALEKESPERYVVSGLVVEITSVEAVSGGAASRYPVRLVVSREQGRWLITEHAAER
jgi:hypothetical protein